MVEVLTGEIGLVAPMTDGRGLDAVARIIGATKLNLRREPKLG